MRQSTGLKKGTCALLLLGIVLLGAGPLLNTPAAAQVVTFTCQNVNAMNHPGFYVIADMIEDLKKMSNGKLIINQIPPGGLVQSTQTFESTGSGAIDMAITYGAYHGGILPVAAASFALPGDPRGIWDMYNFYYKEGGLEFLRTHYAKHNVHYLAPMVWPGYAMMSKREVKTFDDVKRLKVRAVGTMAQVLHNLGVGTTFIPFAEIYVAMSRGAIDATVSGSHAENYLQDLHEVAKYMVTPDFSSAQTLEVLVNLKKFQSMPEELQAMFETAAQKAALHFTRIFMEEEQSAVLKMQAAGAQLLTLADDSVQALRQASYDAWDSIAEKDQPTKEFMEMVKKNLEKLGYTSK